MELSPTDVKNTKNKCIHGITMEARKCASCGGYGWKAGSISGDISDATFWLL